MSKEADMGRRKEMKHRFAACMVVACLMLAAAGSLVAQSDDKVVVTGALVGKNGAPLAGKTVCILVEDADGTWVFPFDLTGGRLGAKTAKTDTQGQFQVRVERPSKLKVGLCEGQGLTTRPVKASKAYPVAKGQKTLSLNKVTVD
jgi:hypothetical protein